MSMSNVSLNYIHFLYINHLIILYHLYLLEKTNPV